MQKYNFKVGDRVLNRFTLSRTYGRYGTVVGFNSESDCVFVKYDDGSYNMFIGESDKDTLNANLMSLVKVECCHCHNEQLQK